MAYPQYYKDLGVKETASMDEIKQAYRELAKKYHPDANNGDKKSEEKLKKVNEAYAVLKDYGRRAEYDYEGQLARERAQKVQKAQTYAASTATAPQSAYYAGNTAAERPARRWLKILIHELFAFGLLCGYVWVMLANADKNDPWNVAKMLSNTGKAVTVTIDEAVQKSKDLSRGHVWRDKLLFYAVRHNQAWLTDKLLEQRPEVNIVDDEGYSLLMRAQNAETAAKILQHKADVNYRAPDGQSAFSLAIKRNDMALVQLLHKHGARVTWKKNPRKPSGNQGE